MSVITRKKEAPSRKPEAKSKYRQSNYIKSKVKNKFVCSMCGHSNPLACADDAFKPRVFCRVCQSADMFEHSRDVRKSYGLYDDISHTCERCFTNHTIDEVLSLSEMLILTRQEGRERFSELEERIEKLERANG